MDGIMSPSELLFQSPDQQWHNFSDRFIVKTVHGLPCKRVNSSLSCTM